MPGSAPATGACSRRIIYIPGDPSLHGVEVGGQQVEKETAANQPDQHRFRRLPLRGDVIEPHHEIDEHREG